MFAEGTRAGKQLATALNRHLCFSYSSFAFLRRHGFQFQEAFENGVPYLSRQEAGELDESFLRRTGRQIAGLDLAQHEEVVRDFYTGAQRAIRSWLLRVKDEDALAYLNLSNPYGGRLTGFQIQLVHHLTEVEFPRCKAQPKHDDMFVQVTLADVEEKEKFKQRQFQERKEAIIRQTGFRYLIDAITGNLFTEDLRTEWMVEDDCDDLGRRAGEIRAVLAKCETKLTARPPVVVGHNQLHDLCFIYQSFIGDLPPRLEDFRSKMHTLFPRMVDTKFLATPPNYHIMMADNSLSMLFDIANDQELPIIVQDPRLSTHMKHQAGFDSWMTAVVFLRKAWNLDEEFCMNMEYGVERDWAGKIVKQDRDSEVGKPAALRSGSTEKEVKQSRETSTTSKIQNLDSRKQAIPSSSRAIPSISTSTRKEQKPALEPKSSDFDFVRQFFPSSSRLATRPTRENQTENTPSTRTALGRWLGSPPTSTRPVSSKSVAASTSSSHQQLHTEPQQQPVNDRRLSVKEHAWGHTAGDAFQSIETGRARRTLPSIARRNIPKIIRDQSLTESQQSSSTGSEDELGQKWPKNPETTVMSNPPAPSTQTAPCAPRGQPATERHATRAVSSFLHPPVFTPMSNPVAPVSPVLTPVNVQQQQTMGSFGVAGSTTVSTSLGKRQMTDSQALITNPSISTHHEDGHYPGYGTATENKSNTTVDSFGSSSETQHRIPRWETAFWRKYGNKIRVATSGSLDLARERVMEE